MPIEIITNLHIKYYLFNKDISTSHKGIFPKAGVYTTFGEQPWYCQVSSSAKSTNLNKRLLLPLPEGLIMNNWQAKYRLKK